MGPAEVVLGNGTRVGDVMVALDDDTTTTARMTKDLLKE